MRRFNHKNKVGIARHTTHNSVLRSAFECLWPAVVLRLLVKRTNEQCMELPEPTPLSLLTAGKKTTKRTTNRGSSCLFDRK